MENIRPFTGDVLHGAPQSSNSTVQMCGWLVGLLLSPKTRPPTTSCCSQYLKFSAAFAPVLSQNLTLLFNVCPSMSAL
jgi:hypothetical protein